MRNIPIPVDTNRLNFVCVAVPRPRLVNKDTGASLSTPYRWQARSPVRPKTP